MREWLAARFQTHLGALIVTRVAALPTLNSLLWQRRWAAAAEGDPFLRRLRVGDRRASDNSSAAHSMVRGRYAPEHGGSPRSFQPPVWTLQDSSRDESVGTIVRGHAPSNTGVNWGPRLSAETLVAKVVVMLVVVGSSGVGMRSRASTS